MKTVTMTIPGALPDLNRYISAMNRNRFVGNQMKQEATDIARYEALSQLKQFTKIETACHITFHWICKNKKIDKDNISFAKKFILDGLQVANIIAQDNWSVVDGFADKFSVDKDNPRIEITINY